MVEIREIPGPEWDEVLLQFRDAVHEQSHAYAAARWGGSRVHCVVVNDGGNILGGALAVVVTLPVLKRGLAIVKFGPLYRRWNAETSHEAAITIVAALKDHFCGKLQHHLTIIPAPPIDGSNPWTGAAAAGIRRGGEISDARRYFIDLSLNEHQQRASLAGRWRRNLTLAEKRGVEVFESTGADGLRQFRVLLDQLIRRKPAVSAAGFNAMASLMSSPHPDLRPRVFLAWALGTNVAGAVITSTGACASYVFGAQSETGARMCASYALQWSIVKALHRQGVCRWYDLGGDNNTSGLAQFKNGFIGTAGRILSVPRRLESSGGFISDAFSSAIYLVRGP